MTEPDSLRQCGLLRVPLLHFLVSLLLVAVFRALARSRSSDSPDRDRDRHIDIVPDRIRVGADGMGTLDESFGGLLVDASHGHGKRCGQHEAPCFISTKVDSGDDVDVVSAKRWPASRLT